MELAEFKAWMAISDTVSAPLGADDPMRAQLITVQNGAKLPAYYPLRQAIKQWLSSDTDGSKATWLKGS